MDGLGCQSLKYVLQGGVEGVALIDQCLGAAGQKVAGQAHLTHQLLVALRPHQGLGKVHTRSLQVIQEIQ